MKQILLVDDHKVLRDGIKYYFEDNNTYSVKGEAENGEQALLLIKNESFDLVITDLSMPKMDGVRLIEEIRTHYPNQKILVLTMHGATDHIKKMIELGVNGYVLKSDGPKEILAAIDKVIHGENYYSSNTTQTIMDELSGSSVLSYYSPLTAAELTKREREVLKLITKEMSNTTIAEKLEISKRTVDAHKRNLLVKTHSKNIAGLVVYAVENRLVKVKT